MVRKTAAAVLDDRGGAQAASLSDEWAARLPLALASLAFLWFFHRTLAREFSPRVALAATGILATSAGWVAYSFVSVTDLPMSAALGAAMLIGVFGPSAIPSRARQTTVLGIWAGVFLGLAVLAKGFVPLVLIAPVLLIARRMRVAMLASCVVVAAPWYVLCYVRNGPVFWNEFFWKHHVDRFLHPTLDHPQPFWYYLPVLLAGLFPWTPLAGLLFRPKTYQDERIRFLVLWLVFGLVFFSAAQNKLPGYVLPLLPAAGDHTGGGAGQDSRGRLVDRRVRGAADRRSRDRRVFAGRASVRSHLGAFLRCSRLARADGRSRWPPQASSGWRGWRKISRENASRRCWPPRCPLSPRSPISRSPCCRCSTSAIRCAHSGGPMPNNLKPSISVSKTSGGTGSTA